MGKMEEQVVERFWKALEAKDWDAAEAVMADDFVDEWPQSGERIVGKDNFRKINEQYPGFPTMKPVRTISGDGWAVHEAVLDYSGKTVHYCGVYQIRDGKLARGTDYYADPFEAPEWRKEWVERM
jgi:ketosteroid isomerase-like protein